jgi:hypothetical protein
MSKKTRYFLLLFGFLLFLILAPLIVLYVRGIAYDFSKKTFVTTGILAVRSDPSSAQIYLHNKLVRKSSGDVRFLVPGEYEVTIKKDGYQDWKKRLEIISGQVTWANPAFGNVVLFFQDPPQTSIAENVADFYTAGSKVAYLTAASLAFSDGPNYSETNSFPLPQPLNTILSADDAYKNFLLTFVPNSTDSTSSLVFFNKPSGKFFDISNLFKQPAEIQLDSTGNLYALSNETFYKINTDLKSKISLITGVKAFYLLNDQVYFLQKDVTGNLNLMSSQLPFINSQTLIKDLPNFKNAQMKVSFEKQIFILGDDVLYLANFSMEKLADNISQWSLQPEDSALSVSHAGQLDYFAATAGGLSFITRSTEPLINAKIKAALGWAFYLKNNKVMAMELDARNRQNELVLYSGQSAKKFEIDEGAKNITVLDNGVLKKIKIR